MKPYALLFLFVFSFAGVSLAQEIDCTVSINVQQLTAEARENLSEFVQKVQDYVNTYRWTKTDLSGGKIKCTLDISFTGSPRDNHYVAQAFIGSQRPVYKSERNTAVLRILDDKLEFDYQKYQTFNHDDFRFDPLLSFVDYYVWVILGYDLDTYGITEGTPFFQKAMEIVNKARGVSGIGKGWEISPQSTYQRGQLVDELLNPKFRDLREAAYRYHYRGLDLLSGDGAKARKNILSSLDKIGKLQDKINQRSISIKIFFDSKYMEIAETFLKDPDLTIYSRLAKIDPAHQKNYDDYSRRGQ